MALDPHEKVEVELARYASVGAQQHDKGDVVEVYPNEAREMAVRGDIVDDVEKFGSDTEIDNGYFGEHKSNAVEPAPSVDEISAQELPDAEDMPEPPSDDEDDE